MDPIHSTQSASAAAATYHHIYHLIHGLPMMTQAQLLRLHLLSFSVQMITTVQSTGRIVQDIDKILQGVLTVLITS